MIPPYFFPSVIELGATLLLPPPGWGRVKRLGDIALVSLSELLLLYSVTQALLRFSEGTSFLREILLFGLSIWLWWSQKRRLMNELAVELVLAQVATQERILARLETVDLLSFERIGRPSLLMRLIPDAEAVTRAGMEVLSGLIAVGTVLLTLAFLGTQALGPALVCFAGMAALAGISVLQVRDLRGLFQRAAVQRDLFHRRLEGLLAGFKQVRQHAGRRESLLGEIRGAASALESERDALNGVLTHVEASGRVTFQALLLFIAFGLPLLFPASDDVRATLLVVVFFIFRPLNAAFHSIPSLSLGAAALGRIRALEAEVTEVSAARVARNQPVAVPDGFEALALSEVSFTFPARPGAMPFGIGPLSFALQARERVFITGANGSGKSTFLRVLTGLYDRDQGALSLNGVALPATNAEPLRERFSAIPTEFVLFERLHGLEHLSADEVNAMLGEMGLLEAVTYDGARLSTLDLSTGQRKRLAMALARLAGRPILVLDEWAADQDPVFRARFYRELLPALRAAGTTVLAVTHDDDYFQVADRRVHFAQGQVVDP